MTRGARSTRVKPPRERRCVATGEVLHESRLLRVALAPDNTLVPDIAAKLPGRGGWVSADRASVELAVRKRLFNRAFEGPATFRLVRMQCTASGVGRRSDCSRTETSRDKTQEFHVL